MVPSYTTHGVRPIQLTGIPDAEKSRTTVQFFLFGGKHRRLCVTLNINQTLRRSNDDTSQNTLQRNEALLLRCNLGIDRKAMCDRIAGKRTHHGLSIFDLAV